MLAQSDQYLNGGGVLCGWDDPNTPIIILTLPNLFLLYPADLGWQMLDRMWLMDFASLVFSLLPLLSSSADCRQCCRLVRDAVVWTRSWCHCRDCSITAVPSSQDQSQMLQRKRNCSRVWGPAAGDINMTLTLLLQIDVFQFLHIFFPLPNRNTWLNAYSFIIRGSPL